MKYQKKFGSRTVRSPRSERIHLSATTYVKRVERDGMPEQVATELLATPGARITNRVRKNAIAARSKFYEPTAKRKEPAEKLADRFKQAEIAQLGKWLRRCISRSAEYNREYARIGRFVRSGKCPKPVAEKLLTIIAMRVDLLEQARVLMNDELTRRQEICLATEKRNYEQAQKQAAAEQDTNDYAATR